MILLFISVGYIGCCLPPKYSTSETIPYVVENRSYLSIDSIFYIGADYEFKILRSFINKSAFIDTSIYSNGIDTLIYIDTFYTTEKEWFILYNQTPYLFFSKNKFEASETSVINYNLISCYEYHPLHKFDFHRKEIYEYQITFCESKEILYTIYFEYYYGILMIKYSDVTLLNSVYFTSEQKVNNFLEKLKE